MRFQFAGGAQDVAAFVQQFAPGGSELGAMPATVEQQHVKVFFELLHGVGKCGWHTVQLMCGGGKAALAVDGVQCQQGFD